MKSGIKVKSKGLAGAYNGLMAKNIERLLTIPGSVLYHKFVKVSKQVAETQEKVLSEIISYAEQTDFGKIYGFKRIASEGDYRAGVPVNDYEDLRPYINRHVQGEKNVLFPGNPLMYTSTSGTTAEPKLIPITPFNFKKTIKNRSKLWLYHVSKSYPGVYSGKDISLVSPAVDGYTPGGVPYGSLSGLMYKNIPEFVKRVHSAPYDVMCIKNYDAKVYSILRFAVPSDISGIFTGNPSTVLNLVTKADAWKELLIKDIFDGTLSEQFDILPESRQVINALLEPAPQRARALEKLAGTSGDFKPADYWPNLKLVHTWTNGNCKLVLPKLSPWFKPDQAFLDFGYIASEINATDIVDPKTNGSLLAIQSGYYEFSPVSEGETPKTFYSAHELVVGEKYYVYVTTYSGLYRYNMNDIVEVIGHFNQVPIFNFLYKGKGVTSLQGEKLSERQLIDAVHQAASQTGFKHEFFEAVADFQAGGYCLYIEFAPARTRQEIDDFGKAVEQSLTKLNVEYRDKRSSQRLNPVKVVPLVEKAFEKYRDIRLAEGAHDGQLKWVHLCAADSEQARLKRLSILPA